MPQSHPTTGPVRFLPPVRFFSRKAEWSARRIFTSVLFSWSHQATGPVQLETAVHLCFGRMIRKTPRVPHAMPVRAPQGNLQCFSYPTGPVRGACGTCRTAPLRTRKGIDTTQIDKNPAQASYLAVRAARGPHRPREWTYHFCSKQPGNSPYGARECDVTEALVGNKIIDHSDVVGASPVGAAATTSFSI